MPSIATVVILLVATEMDNKNNQNKGRHQGPDQPRISLGPKALKSSAVLAQASTALAGLVAIVPLK